mmetsp:Transcript_7504/g.11849  ORF Transcript_7504/g.11849 Transcript_7504/m.11849 type:complete len:87 (-) Transcript_7504:68-328(-)
MHFFFNDFLYNRKCQNSLVPQLINPDKSTTLAVISSCFDLLALPFGNDINMRKLDIFLVFRTLFNTLRTITSETVGMANDREEERR